MAFTKGKEWQETEIEKLKELVATHTYKQIAEIFQCSEGAVRTKARTLGLKRVALNKADAWYDFIFTKYSEEHSVKEAAEHFKVSVDKIKNARKRVGVKRDEQRKRFSDPNLVSKWRKYCARDCMRFGLLNEVDNFISWSISYCIEHGADKWPQDLIKSYIRELIGKDNRKGSFYNAKAIVEEYNEDEPGVILTSPPSQEALDNGETIFAVADELKLTGVPRVVFLLYFVEDFNQEKVAKYLGFSHTMTSVHLTQIQDQIRRNKYALELLK